MYDNESDQVLLNIHEYLRKIGEDTRQGKVPVEKFVINKALTKAPEEYNDAKSQPHVQVALRMKKNGKSVRVGETVPYIICMQDATSSENSGEESQSSGGPQVSFALRAYHPDDLKQDPKLTIDFEYYLNVQVHPPVSRLCHPIDGTDDAQLAECLGLDPAKFKTVVGSGSSDDFQFTTLESKMSDAERFRNCQRLTVKCKCGNSQDFEGPAYKFSASNSGAEEWKSGFICKNCFSVINWKSIARILLINVRSLIKKYYECWQVCEEPQCRTENRQTLVLNHICFKPSCKGSCNPKVLILACFNCKLKSN